MEDWTLEELECAIGTLMLDLRGNWGYDYQDRMQDVSDLLTRIVDHDDVDEKLQIMATQDYNVTKEEMYEPEDGRVFRDECNLYGSTVEEGKTERVKQYLADSLSHPEYSWITE